MRYDHASCRPPAWQAAPHSIVIIPTYNEVDNLEPLVETVLLQGEYHILVVDDSSPDGTGDLAEELKIRTRGRVDVLHRARRLGVGTALRDGLEAALQRGYQWMFQMDADFSHNPLDLPRLAEALDGGADLVIGSRAVPGGGGRFWPWWRRLLSRGGSRYAAWLLRLPVCDLTNGFRGWRREALERLGLASLRSLRDAVQIEMAYRCLRQGGRVVEVPVTSTDRWMGRSKLTQHAVWEALLVVWSLRSETWQRPVRDQAPVRQEQGSGAAAPGR